MALAPTPKTCDRPEWRLDTIDESDDGETFVIVEPSTEGSHVVHVLANISADESDAQLMAASREMYAALQMLAPLIADAKQMHKQYLRGSLKVSPENWTFVLGLAEITTIDAALAKADGELRCPHCWGSVRKPSGR
jgi:soluble cytochrome b562